MGWGVEIFCITQPVLGLTQGALRLVGTVPEQIPCKATEAENHTTRLGGQARTKIVGSSPSLGQAGFNGLDPRGCSLGQRVSIDRVLFTKSLYVWL